jgi:hypothetical protein
MEVSDQQRSWLCTAGMVLSIAALWMAQHPYLGIEDNDASLYSLFALARLHPHSLSADVLLRYGSQDSFTLFTPLYASAIKLFDLEPAAAILTLVGQIAFFGCAWLLARSIMPARWALLAVGLLVTLPSDYGSGQLFRYSETYLTPRQAAEALVLAAITASLRDRRVVAAACLLGGMALHPIMTFTGIVFLACFHVAIPRPKLALTLVIALTLVSLVPILIAPQGVFASFDSEWFSVVERVRYLFISKWTLKDWTHVAVPTAVLSVGALTSGGLVRRLCVAALLLAATGIATDWLYCDVLHSVIFTRMQAWRWLWLVQVMSVVLLPIIARNCWRSVPLGPSAVVLLAVTWVLRGNDSDLLVALACIACAALKTTSPRIARLTLLGTWLAMALALAWTVASKLQYVELNTVASTHQPLLNTLVLRTWSEDGIFYAAILLTIWWILEFRRRWPESAVCCALTSGLCLWLLPLSWQSWTAFHQTPTLHALFGPWRNVIPQRAQVIWPQAPMGAWYLLERPSYYSSHQNAGEIFSRDKSLEMRRRGGLINSARQTASRELPIDADGLDVRALTLLCADPELDFYVTPVALAIPAAAAPISPYAAKPHSLLHLYRCSDLRKTANRDLTKYGGSADRITPASQPPLRQL